MKLLIFQLVLITRGFLDDYRCLNDNVFVNTDFWPELRENTDAYQRFDLSMKQELPIKGLELFLNASNLT